MSKFEIIGGNTLSGEIVPQGAKNEALQVICAVLLTEEEVVIENIPNIRDVNKLIELLSFLGVEVNKLKEDTYSFKAKNIDLNLIQTPEYSKLATGLRGSIMIVGPMLARFHKAFNPIPGGDKIGRRRLDTHYIGFEKLGAKVYFNPEISSYSISADKLKGLWQPQWQKAQQLFSMLLVSLIFFSFAQC